MKEVLKTEIYVICSVHIMAIIVAIVFFMIFYMKARRDYALKAFLLMQVSMIGWMVFKIFKTVSPTELSRWWFIVGYYFCACVFEIAFLEFAFAYYKGQSMKFKVRLLLYIAPLVQFLWVASNPYHHLFYKRYDFWGDSFGPLFYAHTAIMYTYILIGFIYGYKTFRQRHKETKMWYQVMIAGAIILPVVINILFITKLLQRWVFALGIPVVFDITPIVFVISTLIFAYATFNYDLLDLSPILRHEIVNRLDTPICVLDSGLDIIYVNEKLGNLLDLNQLEKDIKQVGLHLSKDQEILIENGSYLFSGHATSISTLKETQYIMTFKDITDIKKVESILMVRQKELRTRKAQLEEAIEQLRRLSKTGARNYVARELHDIIGHSLVVTIKLLEVAKLYVDQDVEESRQALINGMSLIDDGIDAMDNLSNEEAIVSCGQLAKDIEKILSSIESTNFNTHLKFKGEIFKLDGKVYDVLIKSCKELISNSLKHSKGSEIFISFISKGQDVKLRIMDNGIGTSSLVLGNGLKGIKERVDLVHGKVDFISRDGGGFTAKLKIPNM